MGYPADHDIAVLAMHGVLIPPGSARSTEPLADLLALPRDYTDRQQLAELVAAGRVPLELPERARNSHCSLHRHVFLPARGAAGRPIREGLSEAFSRRRLVIAIAKRDDRSPLRIELDPPALGRRLRGHLPGRRVRARRGGARRRLRDERAVHGDGKDGLLVLQPPGGAAGAARHLPGSRPRVHLSVTT